MDYAVECLDVISDSYDFGGLYVALNYWKKSEGGLNGREAISVLVAARLEGIKPQGSKYKAQTSFTLAFHFATSTPFTSNHPVITSPPGNINIRSTSDA